VIDTLEIWLYGTRIAEVERNLKSRLTLRFTDEADRRFGLASPVLSLSLRVRREPYPNAVTRNFLNGLLPEGDSRDRIARELNLRKDDTFGLLAELGRDCAGALVVQPSGGPRPDSVSLGHAHAIDDDEVARRIEQLGTSPLGVDHYVRLSLAGVQRKLLLVRRVDGGWALPADGIPSTHLLKPQHVNPEWPHTVQNEAYSMRLATMAGLNAARVDVEHFNGRAVLVVERFDRRVVGDHIERVHQEDFCQVLDRPTEDKYESDGGPDLNSVADILRRHTSAGDVAELLRLVTFNAVVGNADAHGKNLSILHYGDGEMELAPAYDVMSTMAYPGLDRTLGMYIDDVRNITKVTPNRIINEAVQWGMDRDQATDTVAETLTRVAELSHEPSLIADPALSFADDIGQRAEEMLELASKGASRG
jgi:serine/threonine-protein kinase HipA